MAAKDVFAKNFALKWCVWRMEIFWACPLTLAVRVHISGSLSLGAPEC